MKFTNAYELNLFLHKKDLIEGLDLGLRGEYQIITKINDDNPTTEISSRKYLGVAFSVLYLT